MENLKLKLQEKTEELENLKLQLREKTEELENMECDPDEFEDAYCVMIDETHDEFMGFAPSYVYREIDPTGYRQGLLDYADSMEISDTENYRELEDEIAELEDEIAELEDEIAELEDEIAELEE